MIRLIAIDLDGTLLRSDRTISRATVDCIGSLDPGLKVVLATARPPRSVRSFYTQLKLQTPQINYNGALIFNQATSKAIEHWPIRAADAFELIGRVRRVRPDVVVSCEIMDRWYTDRLDPRYLTQTAILFPPDVVAPLQTFAHLDVTKILLQADPMIIDELASLLVLGDRFASTRTDPDLMQVMRRGVDKSVALRHLAKFYGIDMKDVLAIGDNDNDLQMILAAGVGVVMASSPRALIEAAQWVAPTNDDDGVVAAIKRFVS